jgi:hypothetical protein
VIGDDENLDVAARLGFETVERDNKYVATKFNVGYKHAYEQGATHCMPIGSDSWIHESIFEDEEFVKGKALGIVGLSSFSPDGQERVDLGIKYPAGFGVGMVYPADAVRARALNGMAAAPTLQRGIDNSTWARVGRGQVPIRFMETKHFRYINFHSTEDSITDFDHLRRSSKRMLGYETEDSFEPLRPLYGRKQIRDMERYYALRALQVFLTGENPTFYNPHIRARRPYPYVAERAPQSGGRKLDGVVNRYPKVGERGRPRMDPGERNPRQDAAVARRLAKLRGVPLTREEEMAYRFDQAQGL